MDSLLKDIHYSIRVLLKKPGFAAVVVLTLALGIGANTAVFSVINALLLRPLPYPDEGSLVYVWESRVSDPMTEDSLSPHNYTDIHSRSRVFDAYFAYKYVTFNVAGDSQPEAVTGAQVSAEFGRTMGVLPAIGRTFSAADDVPGNSQAVLLSDAYWKRRFGGDPKVVGTQIRIDGAMATVLGVMPASFTFPGPDVEMWAPLALDLSKYQRGTSFLTTVARLKPGVSVETAQSTLVQLAAQLRKDYPEEGLDFTLRTEALREHLFGNMKRPLMILFGSVAFVLLIACVNVANLMLGRAASRSREMAVRSALGASRAGLIRLLLVEGVLLAILAGAAGLLLAANGVQFLAAMVPAAVPAGGSITIDGTVMMFTLLVSVLTGILFGLFPAWQAAHRGLNETLREGSRATGARRTKLFRASLVVTEIALSLVLLVGAGLLLRSLWKVLSVNPGFDPQNVVTCSISLPRTRYTDPRLQGEFYRRTLEAVRILPGVESAGFATSMPFSGSRGTSSFSIDGAPANPNAAGPEADRHQVSPGYFHTMGIPLRAGRDFSDTDNILQPQVVIINEEAARRFWPSQDPVGKRMTIGMPQETELYGKEVSREIVGIVGNVKHSDLKDDFSPEMYIPAWQLPAANMTLVVRSRVSAEAILGNVRTVVKAIDPEQPVRQVKVLQDSVARSLAPRRFLTTLLILFAFLALALALIGIYAVMSFSVAQRTQEIGVRMALGATTSGVLRLVFGQAVGLAILGIGGGLAATLAVTRVMSGLLFEVSATDAATILTISAAVLVVTLAACLIPAKRAARVDPIVALRYE